MTAKGSMVTGGVVFPITEIVLTEGKIRVIGVARGPATVTVEGEIRIHGSDGSSIGRAVAYGSCVGQRVQLGEFDTLQLTYDLKILDMGGTKQ